MRKHLLAFIHSTMHLINIVFYGFYFLVRSSLLQQKNETKSAFEQTYDIIADGFNDTYMATKRPTVSLLFDHGLFILVSHSFQFACFQCCECDDMTSQIC